MSNPADELIRQNAKDLENIKQVLSKTIENQKGIIENLMNNYFNLPRRYLKYVTAGVFVLFCFVLFFIYRYFYPIKVETFKNEFLDKERLVENEKLRKQNKQYWNMFQKLRKAKEEKDNKAIDEFMNNPIKLPLINHDNPFSDEE